MSFKVCILCNEESGDLLVVGEIGIKSLKEAAKARAEEDRALNFNSGVLVHEKCKKNYANKSNIAKWKNKQENHNKKSSKRTRSHDPLEECCILCGFPLFSRTVVEKEIHIVKNQAVLESFRNICIRRKDAWATEILSRNRRRSQPKSLQSNESKLTKQKQLRLGRPVDEIRQQVFSRICDHLGNNNEDETYTL
ncbi:hypothetical protein DAPPUDRAFT_337967 [Daphnia pulex]|uniref:Uncharacterized protein n=1 Tax=Daphnia pulex TaxID=6669 RepID=E9I2D7_DAPPU|nr:hypothetical protein DAPPUDRAFT_337967 [Daphnia pulex]|eukprot:EFX61843.1 hypothetical protein DAPPUDRAFT_337967 [Daphnia pulex]